MSDENRTGEARDPGLTEIFLRLLSEHERALTIYVHMLVPQAADAQDVLQEMRLAMWRDFERFELGSNFLAWGRKVAYHRVLAHRKKKAVEGRRYVVSEALLEMVAAAEAPASDDRLVGCMARLSEEHRRLLRLRYWRELSIEQVAAEVGGTIDGAYRALSRVRVQLRRCMVYGDLAQ